MPWYMTQEGLDNLRNNYQSHGEDRSILLKFVLRPWYHKLIAYIPMWLSPNLITLSGFLAFLIPFYIMSTFCEFHEACADAPSWVYLLVGIGLFVYQTGDNLDGRQARRTGTSSPLGEFFDHGVDSLIITIGGIGISACTQVTGLYQFASLLFTCWSPFFFGTWEAYYSGNGLLLREFNGPIEGVIISVCLALATGVFGPAMWTQPAPIPVWLASLLSSSGGDTLPINELAICGCVLPAIPTVVMNTYRVLETRPKGMPFYSPLLRVFPFVCVVMCSGGWIAASPTLLRDHFATFYATITMGFAYSVGRLIIAQLQKSTIPVVLLPVLVFPIGFANAMMATPLMEEQTAVTAAAVIVSVSYLYMVLGTIVDLLTLPKVYLFRLPPVKGQ